MANKISVIVTVLNETKSISNLVTALTSQSLRPHEIIIVDGGSQDGTYNQLQSLSKKHRILKTFRTPGSRSLGRNFGVKHSSGNLIAFTDAGCVPEHDWLKNITSPFVDPKVQVVSGYYVGDWKNIFQKCLIPYVLVMPDKADKSEFFPSTRSMCLRRSVWNHSGGFDLRLLHNEDFAYALKLKILGYNFIFARNAIVHWQPRTSLRSAAWMFMRFAMGDIQAGILRPQIKSLGIRYLAATFLFFLALNFHALFYLLGSLVFIYFFLAILKNFKYVRDIRAVFWLPVLQLTADLSVLFGTIVGGVSKAYGVF